MWLVRNRQGTDGIGHCEAMLLDPGVVRSVSSGTGFREATRPDFPIGEGMFVRPAGASLEQ
jgi:hypothetical protein